MAVADRCPSSCQPDDEHDFDCPQHPDRRSCPECGNSVASIGEQISDAYRDGYAAGRKAGRGHRRNPYKRRAVNRTQPHAERQP